MKLFTIRALSIVAAVGFAFGLGGALNGMSDYALRLVMLAGIYVTLSVSLNIINGITGQFSIGHAAFYMVGAYTMALLTNKFYEQSGLSFQVWVLITMVAGALMAAIAGLIVGLPSLRLRGDYLAIVTLGFGEILRYVANANPALGGSIGIQSKPLTLTDNNFVAYIVLLAIICIAVSRNLLKSAHGLAFLAVREDEIAASAMGVNVTSTKVIAFLIGSAFAGAAGATYGAIAGFIAPDHFKMEVSFLVLTMVVLGGTGSITGSAIAAVALYVITEVPRNIEITTADGTIQKLQITLGMLLAMFVALGFFISAIKRLQDKYHKPNKKLMMWLTSIGAVLLMVGLSFALNLIPALEEMKWGVDQMRWVVMAITLLTVMLLRPKGIFGFDEWGIHTIKGILDGFKRKKPPGGTGMNRRRAQA